MRRGVDLDFPDGTGQFHVLKRRGPNDEQIIRRQALDAHILEDRRPDPATVGRTVLDADVPHGRTQVASDGDW
jgi:hypothetical protein